MNDFLLLFKIYENINYLIYNILNYSLMNIRIIFYFIFSMINYFWLFICLMININHIYNKNKLKNKINDKNLNIKIIKLKLINYT